MGRDATATGVTLAREQLVGYARLDLEAGESKTGALVVPMSDAGYTGEDRAFLSVATVDSRGPMGPIAAAAQVIESERGTSISMTRTLSLASRHRVTKRADRDSA